MIFFLTDLLAILYNEQQSFSVLGVWFTVVTTLIVQIVTNTVGLERSMSGARYHIGPVEILRGFSFVADFTNIYIYRLHIRTVSAGFSEIILLRIFIHCCKFIREVKFSVFLYILDGASFNI